MNISAKQQNISRWLLSLLLCSVFTFAQAATLKHSVEHDHHEASSSCEVFAIFSSLGFACTNIDVVNFYPGAVTSSVSALLEPLLPSRQYLKPIRAPPAFT